MSDNSPLKYESENVYTSTQKSSALTLTRKAFDHNANKVAEVRLNFANAHVVLVRFGFQIQSGALDVLDERRVQRHGIAFNYTRTIRGRRVNHINYLTV